ncbi:MAG: hypothetical protein AB1410_09680 [Acidobacteriota bacterium]
MKNKAKMKKLSFVIILSIILTFLLLNSIGELKKRFSSSTKWYNS